MPQTESATTTTVNDPTLLRQAFAKYPQGIVTVAAEVAGQPEALLASSFTVGVSLDPPLVMLAVQHTSSTWPRLRELAPRLGVSVLGSTHAQVTRQLAGSDRSSRFSGVDYQVGDDGAVLLNGSPMWLTTSIYNEVSAGDHDVVILEVHDIGVDDAAQPLVFHESQFKGLS